MTTTGRLGTVIGIDGTLAGESALRWAAARADRIGPLRPVFAWNYSVAPFLPGPLSSGAAPPAEAMQSAAEEAARGFIDAVGGGPFEAPVVRLGDPEQVLTHASETAALVVVGCRHQSALSRWVLGSTSRHLIGHVDAPIVIVPESSDTPDEGGPQRILVGVDGSDHALAALRWAYEHARSDDQLTALSCWKVPVGIGYDVPQFDSENLRAAAIQTVHDAAAAVEGDDRGRIECRVAEGDPRPAIIHESKDYDMLVLGARGRSGVAHLFLGSTTTALTSHPELTTVVVP